ALKKSKEVNPGAYEAYLKGRYFWNKRSGEGLRKAIDYFNLAIDTDPDYARAYSGLADSYALSGDWEYGILSPQDASFPAKIRHSNRISPMHMPFQGGRKKQRRSSSSWKVDRVKALQPTRGLP